MSGDVGFNKKFSLRVTAHIQRQELRLSSRQRESSHLHRRPGTVWSTWRCPPRTCGVASCRPPVEQRARGMTYCIGVMLDKGMVFASDSRTNAGVDNFAKFCKMTVFERRGDRVIVLLSSGNLAGTQAVIGVLNQRCAASDAVANLWSASTLFDVAMLVADGMRDIERRDGEYLQENEIGFNASFIVGGQIRGESLRLFRIYAE